MIVAVKTWYNNYATALAIKWNLKLVVLISCERLVVKHCTTYNFKIRDFYNDTYCQNEMFAKENENGNVYKMGELFRGFKFKSHYKPISAFSEKHLL